MSPGTRHVIFDLDGTLLDTEQLYTDAARIVCERYGARYDLELKRKIMGGDTLRGAQLVVETLKLPLTPEAYVAEREAVMYELLPTLSPMPHAVALIEALSAREVPMAIATSGHRQITETKLSLQPWLKEHIKTIVCGDDARLVHPKPAPDIYLLAAAELGLPPAKAAALEDSLNGVRAAAAAGMRTIALVDPRWGFDRAQFQAYGTVVTSLAEVTFELLGVMP